MRQLTGLRRKVGQKPMDESVLLRCSFENWQPKMRGKTTKAKILPMDKEFLDFLNDEEFILDESRFPEFRKKVESVIEDLGGKVFVKLNYSAPTDASWIGSRRTLEVKSFDDMVYLLKGSSRIFCDLEMPFGLAPAPTEPIIVFKKWLEYYRNREFRLFYRRCDAYLISSRYVDVACKMDSESVEDGAAEVVEWVHELFGDDVELIVDFYISPKGRPHIVDIAPYNRLSNTGMFTWDEIDGNDAIDIRLCKNNNVFPAEDPAVPAEMLDGQSIEQLIASFREFEKEDAASEN